MYRLWQASIAVLVLIGCASLLGAVFGGNDQGTFGITFSTRRDLPPLSEVSKVAPKSPAGRQGIRPGDRLQFSRTVENRVMLFATVPGDSLTVTDGARQIHLVADTSDSMPSIALVVVLELARLSFLIVGAFVAWRRSDDPAARALAVFLCCFGAGITFDVVAFSSIWSRFVLLMFLQTIFVVGAIAALAFACRFPAVARRGVRAALNRAAPAIGLAGGLLSIVTIAALFAAPFAIQRVVLLGFIAFYIAAIVATFVALVLGYRESLGPDRARARWALGTIALGLSGLLAYLVLAAAGDSTATTQYLPLATLVIPFGLAYAILRHQMLDITFVINRAVVYAGVSVVIVGAFIVFEWLLGHLVEQNSRASVVLELLAALALGLSTRFIHARVDRFVDNLFFRERHAAEAAVRRFGHEAGLITTIADLVAKTVEVAETNIRLCGASFYVLGDGGYAPLSSTMSGAGPVGENDYAVLDMRTWHAPVEILGRGSVLPGAVAFPMMVRGSLAGFLLCGEKTTHEALTPDERDALGGLATSSGLALDSLRVRTVQRELSVLASDAGLPQQLRAKLALLSPAFLADGLV